MLASPPEDGPRVLPLADLMSVGRLGYGYDGTPIQLHDPAASAGRHTVLRRTPDGLEVHDLGGSNVTYLNGRAVERARPLLRVGDVIRVGRSLLRFEHTLPGSPWLEAALPLLRAVLAAPADDAPRRALAEWLVARGDPRGEFIRCQLAGTSADLQRAAALLAEHELTWVAPLPVPVESWSFARGFLTRVRVRDVAAAEALRRFHPLAELEPLG